MDKDLSISPLRMKNGGYFIAVEAIPRSHKIRESRVSIDYG
jgi:hypothetical protein